MGLRPSKFREIERKYILPKTFEAEAFLKLCEKLKPVKRLEVSGPDTYFRKNDDFLRWRRNRGLNELTVKERHSEKTSLIRDEKEVELKTDCARTIISFISALGYRKLFRVHKTCHIYWYGGKNSEVSVVLYRTECRGFPPLMFVEIEPKKGLEPQVAKVLISEWEERLGLPPHWRINKTLLEIFSGVQTPLVSRG